jgi:hypothetical protein
MNTKRPSIRDADIGGLKNESPLAIDSLARVPILFMIGTQGLCEFIE